MAERQGKSEPVRAQAPEKAPAPPFPPGTPTYTPPPGEQPVRQEPKRFPRVRKWAKRTAVGATTVGVLGGVGVFGYNAVRSEPQGQENPGLTGPRVIGVESGPTGGTGTTNPPEKAIGPTGPENEVKPSPFEKTNEFINSLGYTSTPERFFDNTIRVYSTGILADITRQKIDFLDDGQKMSVWVFKFYFGQDEEGKPIYMNFSYGPDYYNSIYYFKPGAVAPTALDPSAQWDTKSVDSSVLKKMLEKKIGHQFGLEIPIKAESGPWINWDRYEDSAELIKKLQLRNKWRKENIKLDADNIGFISGLYFPPKK